MRLMLLVLSIIAMTVGFGLLEGSDPQSAGGVGIYFAQYFATSLEHSGAMLLIVAAVAITMRRDRGADLSAASVCVLAAAVMHYATSYMPLWAAAVPIGLAMAVGLGGFNALLIRRVRTAPMLITLGMMLLAWCGAMVVVKQTAADPLYSDRLLAQLVRPVFIGPLAGGVFAMLYLLQRFTPLIHRAWALYPLSGLLAGGAALMHLSAHGQAQPDLIIDLELAGFVAALLGGMRLTETRGCLLAALLAGMNLAVLREGCISLQARLGDGLPLSPRAVNLLALTGLALLILGIRWRKARRAAR
ncbi:hypothetical protein HED60_03615 [Planctomycetales bacterium ZRK34]|nr:hypothetical protein HED60_03615 [Planctomycetales bacterium ZRK34]